MHRAGFLVEFAGGEDLALFLGLDPAGDWKCVASRRDRDFRFHARVPVAAPVLLGIHRQQQAVGIVAVDP